MQGKKLSVKGDFSRLLKSLRINSRTHWTQKSLAAELRAADLKVSLRTYKGYERGESIPSPEVLKHIVVLFELSREDEDTLYRAAAQVVPENVIPEVEEPEIYHVPFLRNRFFTGREAYLDELSQILQKEGIVAISGLGGIGKTQIALEYAHRSHPNPYRVVLWVNAADSTTLRTDFASLDQVLKLPEQDESAPEQRVDAVKDWLGGHSGWLLIMDNADELLIVEEYLPSKLLGHILLTTRWHPSVAFAKLLPLEAMNAEEGRNFLLGRTGRSPKGTEADAVVELVEALGGHALALEQAGAYIDQTYIPFADYLKIYKKNSASLLSQHGALKDEHYRHRLTVAATFMGSLMRAMELSPLAEDIMHFCAFLQPDVIPHELLEHDERFKSDALALEEGLAALQRYSLLTPNELKVLYPLLPHPIFSMHRLVQVVLIDNMSPDIQKHRREQVVRALCAAFPGRFDYVYCRQCSILLPQVLECAGWSEDELILTVETAALFHKAGCFQWGQLRYSEAETLLLRAISIYEQHIGAEHPRTLSALINLAATFLANDKYSHAERVYRQALAVSEKLLGTEDFYTAIILRGLTAINICQGKHEQNEPLFDRINHILFIVEQDFAAEQLPTASVFKIYKALICSQGRYEQAEFLHRYMSSVTESSD